jgi:uncharacterized protein
MNPLLWLLALVGHAFLWIGLVNRMHAVGVRRWIIKLATVGFFACAALIPIAIGCWLARGPERPTTASWGVAAYAAVCLAAALATCLRLAYFCLFRRLPSIVRFHGRRLAKIDLTAAARHTDELAHHPLVRLPLNEILRLEVTQWVLDVPRLAPALDSLSIVHLSDLHLMGRVGKAYFREVVRTCNELRPDLVCITGDIVERPVCLDWIADTLGQLAARHGVYFVLGNHDRRVDTGRLRHTLEQSGLKDLGGRWLQIDIGGTPVLLAGNERPWFRSAADLANGPPPAPTGPLRILLAHTPDQLAWARAHRVDLMLAGHTHGGQICIPPLGPIFAPTFSGVNHASGVFFAPPTILHVTRGVSGDIPVRWNCPPEIAYLRLTPTI